MKVVNAVLAASALAAVAAKVSIWGKPAKEFDWTGPPTPGRLMSEDRPREWLEMHRNFMLEPSMDHQEVPNKLEVNPLKWFVFHRVEGKVKVSQVYDEPSGWSKIDQVDKEAIRLRSVNCACIAEVDRRGRFSVYSYHESTGKYLPIWDNGVTGNKRYQQIRLGMSEKFDRMEWIITDSTQKGANGGARGNVIWTSPGRWWNGDDNTSQDGSAQPIGGWFHLILTDNCELQAWKQERKWSSHPHIKNGVFTANNNYVVYWSSGAKVNHGLVGPQNFCYGPTKDATAYLPDLIEEPYHFQCFDQLGSENERCKEATLASDAETISLCQSSSGVCSPGRLCDTIENQWSEAKCNRLIRYSGSYVRGAACDMFYDKCVFQCGACMWEADYVDKEECRNKGGDRNCRQLAETGSCYDPKHALTMQEDCKEACGYCQKEGGGRRRLVIGEAL